MKITNVPNWVEVLSIYNYSFCKVCFFGQNNVIWSDCFVFLILADFLSRKATGNLYKSAMFCFSFCWTTIFIFFRHIHKEKLERTTELHTQCFMTVSPVQFVDQFSIGNVQWSQNYHTVYMAQTISIYSLYSQNKKQSCIPLALCMYQLTGSIVQ